MIGHRRFDQHKLQVAYPFVQWADLPAATIGGVTIASAEVHIWVIDLTVDLEPVAGEILSRDERDRAARFAVADARRRFERRRVGLRRILARYLGVDPAAVVVDRTCARCGHAAHGKPRLPAGSPAFSTAASGDVAVVAVANGMELGVDIESSGAVHAAVAGRLPDSLLTEGERRRLAGGVQSLETLWLRKEALSKAIGTGLVAGPAELDTENATPDWLFYDLPHIHGCTGVLAASGPVESMRVSEWP
jgi:phosphopantetheinyl transferase